jgi:hypothetical protein
MEGMKYPSVYEWQNENIASLRDRLTQLAGQELAPLSQGQSCSG